MTDQWEMVEKEYKKKRHIMSMNVGVFAFKFVRAYQPVRERNNYKKASSAYKDQNGIEEGQECSYIMRPFEVKVLYWDGKPLEGKYVKTRVSDKVFMSMAELRLRIKRAKYEIGDIVVVWKPSKSRVRFMFLTEKMWEYWKEYLIKKSEFVMKNGMSWYGKQERFDEEKFKEFYGGIENG